MSYVLLSLDPTWTRRSSKTEAVPEVHVGERGGGDVDEESRETPNVARNGLHIRDHIVQDLLHDRHVQPLQTQLLGL